MKKVLLVLFLGSMILSACSTYTCPTYSNTGKSVPAIKEQIQQENV